MSAERFYFVVLKFLRRDQNAVARIGSIVPAGDFHTFSFEIFIDREEVRNLLEHVGIYFASNSKHLYIEGCIFPRRGFFRRAYPGRASRAGLWAERHYASEKLGIDKDEHVERIAVIAEGWG